MREPIQPIYSELLAIMLNSEIVQLTESRKEELLQEAYTPDSIKELEENQFIIISILASGSLVISSLKYLDSYEDIEPSDLILN